MNLVKWFRKNNKKVMAVVVIVIMIGFIGGSYIQRLSRKTDRRKTVAYFGINKKITNYDLAMARQELEILRMLRVDDMLRGIGVPIFGVQDLQPLILSELLFSEAKRSSILNRHMKQTVRLRGYRISEEQINDIYRRPMGAEMYWLLLTKEAQRAGIRVPNKDAGLQLAKAIPQVAGGATYEQLVGALVKQQGIPEKTILATFAKLLAVLQYSYVICSTEDVTAEQIRQAASWEREKIDAEFVKFDSAVFADNQAQPSEEEITEQFNKYKKFFAGNPSEENPYGFGYKLADRVGLEYIAVRLDDISKTVTAPTDEEAEEFYQKNTKLFTEKVPSDPNDPNSALIERTKSYAEAAQTILNQLLQNKINSRAARILQEAGAITEIGLENIDKPDELTAEQLRQMAGDYRSAAEKLSEKYKTRVYSGKTGLLRAIDMSSDRNLATLYIKGYGQNMIKLSRVVFAVKGLEDSELGPFDVPRPRMYENIGPAFDAQGKIMAVFRIISIENAAEPESIDQSYSKSTLKFDQEEAAQDEAIYSAREKVVEDLKKLAAMDTTENKAMEFADFAREDGWDRAVDEFNRLYGKEDQNQPFVLQSVKDMQRIPTRAIGTLAFQVSGNPEAQILVGEAKKGRKFAELLYSLVPQDSNTVQNLPAVIRFKPEMSYYCLKDVTVKRAEQEQYEKIKALQVYREDVVQTQALAAVHFNPENILKRMNLRPAASDARQRAEPAAEKAKGK